MADILARRETKVAHLTPDQLAPLLLVRFRDALNRRLGDTNRTGQMMRWADDLGRALSTIKTRVYGEALPDAAEWEAWFLMCPGLRAEVMGKITGEKADAAERELGELKAEIARLHERAGNGGLRAVPSGGKV